MQILFDGKAGPKKIPHCVSRNMYGAIVREIPTLYKCVITSYKAKSLRIVTWPPGPVGARSKDRAVRVFNFSTYDLGSLSSSFALTFSSTT